MCTRSCLLLYKICSPWTHSSQWEGSRTMVLNGITASKWIASLIVLHMFLSLSGSGRGTQQEPIKDWQSALRQAQYKPPSVSDQAPQSGHAVPDAEAKRQSYKYTPDEHHDLSKLKSVEVTATGYFAGKESTGKNPSHPEYGITFSGMKVVRNEEALSTVAADPKVFPLGTVLYIPGYGYGIVADTGSAIKGKKIDLYFETKNQVYSEWGKKKVSVYVLKNGQGKLTRTIWNEYMNELFPFIEGQPVNGKTK